MSVQAMTYVIDNSKHKGSAFVLLLMIANRAHPDGTNAFASIPVLAKDARLQKRHVYNLLPILEASGELEINRGAGRLAHRYTVVMNRNGAKIAPSNGAKFDTPVDCDGVQNSHVVVQNSHVVVQSTTRHIRNRTHEPMNPKRGGSTKGIESKPGTNGTAPPLLASPDSGKKPGIAYQKLADVCGIHLPATGREDSWLRAAIRDLRSKMESDDDANPEHETVTPRQAVQAIEALLNFWRSQDWRGKRGEFPKPAQLVESYGAAKVWARN